jgi:hypothetical protein
MSGGLVRNVGGDRGDPEPGAYGFQRFCAAGDDYHPGAMRDQGLDQSEAKSAASTSHDDILILEAHLSHSIALL